MTALPYVSLEIFFMLTYFYTKISKLEKIEGKYICFIVLAIFICFRAYVFTDVFAYKLFFDNAPTIDKAIKTNYFYDNAWHWEYGFVFYCCFIKTFTSNYFVFQFIDSLINIVLLYKALDYFDSLSPFSIMVFLAMSGLVMIFDTVRNIKSIMVFFISLKYVEKNNYLKYFFCCIVAFLFHQSSFIFFICYPFLIKIRTKKSFALLCILSILFSMVSRFVITNTIHYCVSFFSGRLSNLIDNYIILSNKHSEIRILGLGTFEKIFTSLIIFFYFDKLNKNKKDNIIINVFLLYYISYFSLFGFSDLSNRVSNLFVFSYWILWPKIVFCPKNRSMQYIIIFSIMIYCILKMSLYKQNVQKYESILFDYSEYAQRLYILNKFKN